MIRIRKIIKEQKKLMILLFLAITLVPYIFVSMWGAGIHDISFGVYDGDNSALSKNIVQMLDSTEDLDVCYFAESPEELTEAVKYKTVAVGIIIPENFSADMGRKLQPTAIILANGTDVILGGTAMGAAGKVIGTMNAGIQLKTLEGSGLMPQAATTSLGTFSFVERLMYEPTGGFVPKLLYTIPLMITVVLYIEEFFMPYMINMRKKLLVLEKDSQKTVIKDCITTITVMSVWIILSSFAGLAAMNLTSGLPLRGNLGLYFLSMTAFVLNMNAFSLICFAVVRKEKYFALFIQFFCMMTSTHVIMSGLNFPFHMMPTWVQLLSKAIYPITPMAMELKALNLKGIGFEQTLPYLLDSLRYTIMWIAISLFILKKDLEKNGEKEIV